jgi:hypothetical protein
MQMVPCNSCLNSRYTVRKSYGQHSKITRYLHSGLCNGPWADILHYLTVYRDKTSKRTSNWYQPRIYKIITLLMVYNDSKLTEEKMSTITHKPYL